MPKAHANGINIDYEVEGRGEPLVLLMGFGGPRTGWFFHRPVYHSAQKQELP